MIKKLLGIKKLEERIGHLKSVHTDLYKTVVAMASILGITVDDIEERKLNEEEYDEYLIESGEILSLQLIKFAETNEEKKVALKWREETRKARTNFNEKYDKNNK